MFEIHSKKIDLKKENNVIKKEINLDEKLDCFLLISCSDHNFSELLLNKIVDSIVGKIGKKNTSRDFGKSLENINSIIDTWNSKNEKKLELDIMIGILNKNNFYFSNIGNSCCYLVKNNFDVSEGTDKNEIKTKFGFIFEGELEGGDIIVLATNKLLNYLSRTDLVDGIKSDDFGDFVKNIKQILEEEKPPFNIAISCIKYKNKKKDNVIKPEIKKILDSNFSKKVVTFSKKIKDNFNKRSKKVKNIVFISGILISFSLLFVIISNIVSVSNDTSEKEVSKINFLKAREYMRIASENVTNPDIFESNMKKAEELVAEIKDKELYLNDIEKFLDEISTIKKQFNGVETYEESDNNLIYESDGKDNIGIFKNNGKIYILKKNSIVGPIIAGKKSEQKIFDKLDKDEEFMDATLVGNDLIILTNKSKVVRFSKSGYFSFTDVVGQKKWENSSSIKSYGQNIYLVGNDTNQIYKHKKSGLNFLGGTNYIEDKDSIGIGKISNIAIDGGIYILKNDLSIVKIFGSPKYRIEKIVINKLPKNYNKEEGSKDIKLKTNNKLSYVYMLLNEKIFIFKPNTKRFQNTKSLTYIGQIEGEKYKIKDFYIDYDGDLLVLNEKGIYKLEFEISDDKLIVR